MQNIVKQCMALIESAKNGYGTNCPYCGALSLGVLPNEAVCNFCETYFKRVLGDSATVSEKKMAALNADAIKGETKSLDAYADELKKQAPSPLTLYGLGNLYWVASSSKYTELNYALEGFMEQNSENIRTSLDTTSKSKEYLYKTLDAIQHIEHAEDVTLLVYTSVLCNIRLGRLFHAHASLGELNKIQTGGLARSYANMAYAVSSKSRDALQFIRPLMNTGEPSAVYYFARTLAQKKEFDEASLILEALTNTVNMPMCSYLLRSIKELRMKTET